MVQINIMLIRETERPFKKQDLFFNLCFSAAAAAVVNSVKLRQQKHEVANNSDNQKVLNERGNFALVRVLPLLILS